MHPRLKLESVGWTLRARLVYVGKNIDSKAAVQNLVGGFREVPPFESCMLLVRVSLKYNQVDRM